MKGKTDTTSNLKQEKLNIMFCHESFIPEDVLSEIKQKGIDNMPSEKLFTEKTYTQFKFCFKTSS